MLFMKVYSSKVSRATVASYICIHVSMDQPMHSYSYCAYKDTMQHNIRIGRYDDIVKCDIESHVL